MPLLFRAGLYILGGLGLCQYLGGGPGGFAGIFPSGKILALDPQQGMIFGVCAGLYNYTGIDVTVIRFLLVLAALYRGLGVGLYLLAFFLMPM